MGEGTLSSELETPFGLQVTLHPVSCCSPGYPVVSASPGTLSGLSHDRQVGRDTGTGPEMEGHH